MLHVDQQRTKESGGPKLVTNPDLARRLASMLDRELKRGAPNDDVIKMQAYLAKTLSYFRVPEEVLPVLQQAITSDRDRDVRRNALAAIATIAYRESEAKTPLKNPELLSNILEASADSDPVIRQLAAYNLGLLGGEKAQERLESMLRDADENTRANAAIGLARQHSTAGLPVLKEMVKSAEGPVEAGSQGEYEQFVLLTNCITAIDRLTPELDAQQRSELVTLLKPATEHRESRVRIEAEKTVVDLQGAGGSK
jgi:HEAT repeat protein